ncbi:cysteine desulfurase [Floricoccus penangensis]|uniref:Cysteine desulfurase n=1 Tax=Floricoccus penangensis TaxID=1859475 RepID=A0A9Q5JFF0_9LACT|nr:DUF1831 domain-containing protein [Floricoccus penangensis]OFI45804.1 cysteine desulfurase [Floricoccus penangensis]
MAFEKEIHLEDSKYKYTLSPGIKKYTLKDTTFKETKTGNYELTRNLEFIPNSNDGFLLKITVNKTLDGFKMIVTDKSGLRRVNIFDSEENTPLAEKFYFQLDSLIDRNVFTKEEI